MALVIAASDGFALSKTLSKTESYPKLGSKNQTPGSSGRLPLALPADRCLPLAWRARGVGGVGWGINARLASATEEIMTFTEHRSDIPVCGFGTPDTKSRATPPHTSHSLTVALCDVTSGFMASTATRGRLNEQSSL